MRRRSGWLEGTRDHDDGSGATTDLRVHCADRAGVRVRCPAAAGTAVLVPAHADRRRPGVPDRLANNHGHQRLGGRKATSVLPELWFVILGVTIALVVGMVFLVVAEALVPSGSVPGLVYVLRGIDRK